MGAMENQIEEMDMLQQTEQAPQPEPQAQPEPQPAPQSPEQGQPAPEQGAQQASDEQAAKDVLFGADLNQLEPEVRQRVEPIVKNWQSQLTDWKSKQEEEIGKFKQHAQAFQYLSKHPEFIKWYQDQVRKEQAGQQAPGTAQSQVQQATQNLTQEQIEEAYSDPQKWQSLISQQMDQLVQQKYAPVIDQIQARQQAQEAKQKELDASIEMESLFRNHPDAYELDSVGLLEPFLYDLSDRQGKPMEVAYKAAKGVYDKMMAKVGQKATGVVQGARESITQGPSTSTQDGGVQLVNSADEALRKQIEANMEGRKVKFKVRPRK